MNKLRVMNKLLWGLGIVLVFFAIFLLTGFLLIDNIPSRWNIEVSSCIDSLYGLDHDIVRYHDANGKYPDCLEELYPEYTKFFPECDYGEYTIDTSGTYPCSRCSCHGTVADYHSYWGPKWIGINWSYLALKASVLLAFFIGAASLLLFARKKERESIISRYAVPMTLCLGGLLIIVSTLIPIWREFNWGTAWVWKSTWLGFALVAFSFISIITGLFLLFGMRSRALLVLCLVMFLGLAANSILVVVSVEEESVSNLLPFVASEIKSVGLGLYLLASGALVSLLGFIAALLDTRKKSRETIPATNNPPAAVTVCARSR